MIDSYDWTGFIDYMKGEENYWPTQLCYENPKLGGT